MKNTIVILVSILCFTIALGENTSKDYEKAKSLTKIGISHLLNFEFGKANEIFDEVIKNYPDYPQAYISKSALPMWKFLFGKSSEDYSEAIKLVDKAIQVSEAFAEKNKKDPHALTSLGIAYGNRVFIKLRNENYLGMVFDLRKSYSAFNEAVRINPNYYDAYLGLGIYHYSIGSLPKALKWIISLLGFEGNIEKGLKEIELAAEKGNFQKVEAEFYLTQFYPWHTGEFDRAKIIINNLLQQYPENQIFLYTSGVFNINLNYVDSAMNDFLKIKNQKYYPIPKLFEFTLFRLGECNFKLGKYNLAIDYYKEFLKSYNEEIYITQAFLNLGIALEFTNKREEALQYYNRATKSKSKYGDDLYAKHMANNFIKNRIGEVDSLIIVARNYHKSGKYLQALAIYNSLLKRGNIGDTQENEILFRYGECCYDAKMYDDAKMNFIKIIDKKPEQSSWLIPWSKFYLGQINLKSGNQYVAKNYFIDVLNHSNYLNERWLRYRTERTLKLLN